MMDETKSDGLQATSCCAAGEGCDCGPTPTRRSWPKTLISAVVLLAAIAIGAYSLMTKGAADGGRSTRGSESPMSAGTASMVAPGAAAASRPACCGGEAKPRAAVASSPVCCGGEANPAPPICAMVPASTGGASAGAAQGGCCNR
jgi:hypothetical protein